MPFDDLHVLLENRPRRVMLKRAAFQKLLEQAKQSPQDHAPRSAALVAAEYDIAARDGRAIITGTLTAEVMADGLHALPLDVTGVGFRSLRAGERPAPVGLADDGRVLTFLEGPGAHELVMEAVAPLSAGAATQVLQVELPTPPATRLRLTVPGDVEVKSGAAVASRVFDAEAEVTRFELVAGGGPLTLVMSLNSRLAQADRVVVARSVMVDEVTAAHERLHATVSLSVLHRAIDEARFAVPEGFDILKVDTPQLARWSVDERGGERVLTVKLRRAAAESVVIAVTAERREPVADDWAMPFFQPLDTVGHVMVAGLLVEDRLTVPRLTVDGGLPLDLSTLRGALPGSVLEAEPGAPPIRPLVAYYVPRPGFELTARFKMPEATFRTTTNLVLVLDEKQVEIGGGFAI